MTKGRKGEREGKRRKNVGTFVSADVQEVKRRDSETLAERGPKERERRERRSAKTGSRGENRRRNKADTGGKRDRGTRGPKKNERDREAERGQENAKESG